MEVNEAICICMYIPICRYTYRLTTQIVETFCILWMNYTRLKDKLIKKKKKCHVFIFILSVKGHLCLGYINSRILLEENLKIFIESYKQVNPHWSGNHFCQDLSRRCNHDYTWGFGYKESNYIPILMWNFGYNCISNNRKLLHSSKEILFNIDNNIKKQF